MKKRKWQFWRKETPQMRSNEEFIATTWPWEMDINVTNPTMAMKIATVYRCVDILSSTIASLPLQLKVKRNGVFEVNETSDLAYLLGIQANERQTAYEMKQNAVIQ